MKFFFAQPRPESSRSRESMRTRANRREVIRPCMRSGTRSASCLIGLPRPPRGGSARRRVPAPRAGAPSVRRKRGRRTQASTLDRLLNPETVHARKRVRAIMLERAPAIEIDHGGVVREARRIVLHREQVEIEAEEHEPARPKKI